MNDLVMYRFPNEKIVELNGSFQKVNKDAEFSGFTLSDYSLDTIYVLKTDETDASDCVFQSPNCISEQNYIERVSTLLSKMKQDDIQKVVFSRVKEIDNLLSPYEIFERLENAYPNAFVYMIQSSKLGNWLGATPERLVEIENGQTVIMSLAGTKATNDESEWGDKERLEQQYVTKYISSSLDEKGVNYFLDQVSEYQAGPVKHLVQYFQVENKINNWELVKAIHPTPAIGGVPSREASRVFQEMESHDRELYTGVIGVRDKESRFYVNLRCARKIEGTLYLFLGGGITLDSDPKEEWEETENKAETFLRILKNQ